MNQKRLIHGHWMVSELGVSRRYRHFVVVEEQVQLDRDGWPVGYRALCGKLSIPASARYLKSFPPCPTCVKQRPHILECPCT